MSGQSAGGEHLDAEGLSHERSGREFLEQRNGLWAVLRVLEPGAAAFETKLSELSDLTGWSRARILAGLGFSELDGSGLRNSELGDSELGEAEPGLPEAGTDTGPST
ncbi:hypothetical protein ACFFLM_17040 [Deinococcus oregonensis]|uniref:Uncharacterized protein n=1 Tax=Deinococcus oregonensis TaxID=1805970 RepID=A0ABV6B445_9DEIO